MPRTKMFAAALIPLTLLAASACATPDTQASPAGTSSVDCSAGDTIGAALQTMQPGDTLNVTGTCQETVFIPRSLTGITLDGQGRTGTIKGPPASTPATSPASFTVFSEATGVTVRNFQIVGGAHAVHLSGPATMNIENNVVRDSGGAIHLDKGSIGQIIGNEISNNYYGINLQEDSYARIGTKIPTLPDPVPNRIVNNAGPGITLGQKSSAWIVGNVIVGNEGDGVWLDRHSIADVVGNDISGNSGNGIVARHGSGVNLSGEGTARDDPPNRTDPRIRNGDVGVRCEIAGYVSGPLGTLAGDRGKKRIDRTCVDASSKGSKR